MKGDYSRVTFDPTRHYSGVRLQQGRVQLDADWNEQVDIADHRDTTTTDDLIGACGAPMHTAGFAVQPQAGDLLISAGRYYVDGILCENEQPVAFTAQPDLPGSALPTTAGSYVAYLDVWQRHLTALEQPDLREVALGGPDTATRTRTIWQVRLEAVAGGSTCAQFGSGWIPANTQSTGRLRAQAAPGSPTIDECMVPPGGGYRRLENQLYRVEIQTPGAPGTATFAWSRDNGTIVAGLTGITGSIITVSDPGKDAVLSFANAKWVELTDAGRTLRGEPGLLVELASVQGDTLTVQTWPNNTALTMADFGAQPIVRRWDSLGATTVTTGSMIELEAGVQVEFDTGSYLTGDYWLIPARSLTGDVEWPRDTAGPIFKPRQGMTHHYCALAVVEFNGETWTLTGDCRRLFPPATELTGLFYISGDGQEAMPGQPVPQPLQVGVANGQWWITGAQVNFKITAGSGTIQSGGSSGSAITVTTDAQGIAACSWTLDATNPSQQVEATLVGGMHLPIRFNANLSTAAAVAYDPTNCPSLAEATTVQQAIDQLCRTRGADRGFGVKDVVLNATEASLINDTTIATNDFVKGVRIVCEDAIDPLTISRATCFVTLDVPLALAVREVGGNAAAGYYQLHIANTFDTGENTIFWIPTPAATAWLLNQLPGSVPADEPRLLTHLTLKGNYIWSRNDPEVFLDGDSFGIREGDNQTTSLRFPSGDGRRGGDFEMWFWLELPKRNQTDLVLVPGLKARLTSDPRIRQAISFAINRAELGDVLPPNYQIADLPFDPAQAKKIVTDVAPANPVLTVMYIAEQERLAGKLAGMVRANAGLVMELQSVGRADLLDRVKALTAQGVVPDLIIGDANDARNLTQTFPQFFDGDTIRL